jgi:hypothetical protein
MFRRLSRCDPGRADRARRTQGRATALASLAMKKLLLLIVVAALATVAAKKVRSA